MDKSSQSTACQEASDKVLIDLVNAIIFENLFNILDKAEIFTKKTVINSEYTLEIKEGELLFQVWLVNAKSLLVFPVVPAFLQAYRISRPKVILIHLSPNTGYKCQALDPVEVMIQLIEAYCDESMLKRLSRIELFLEELKLAVKHTSLSISASSSILKEKKSFPYSLINVEHFASLRDRPFHPTAKAKVGWSEQDYKAFSPESGQSLRLDWVAVRRDRLLCADRAHFSATAELVTNDDELLSFATAFERLGISQTDYLALPVHPWQRRNVLPFEFESEFESGICVPLDIKAGQYVPTSSLRSLAPVDESGKHVKVPVGIYSLGAQRLLSARQLINGEIGQLLLSDIIDSDSRLKKHIFLCDETKWWIFHDSEKDLFKNKPGQLSCVIRQYPTQLHNDEHVKLIPMCSLSVHGNPGKRHLFYYLLKTKREQIVYFDDILDLFSKICSTFVSSMLIFFRYGIMPEVHGQNVLLVIRDQDVVGLMLRDFSTVRVYLPWLKESGFESPKYIINTSDPGTLINNNPEDLLSFFQTLGIQINLGSIIEALSCSFEIKEYYFWLIVKEKIKQAISDLSLPNTCNYIIKKYLFYVDKWPSKLVISPLLERLGTGGSMPSAYGETNNPFCRLEEFLK